MKLLSLLLPLAAASHFDEIAELDNLKFDKVAFRLKKDCSLDNKPDIKRFLEVESAHYPELGVFIASEGEARFDLYEDKTKVDTIYVFRWSIEEIRRLLEELGLKRDETITWEKKEAEAKLAQAFMGGAKK